jgi:hypothetical protein
VSLHNGDVSPVTFPAYLDTEVAVRAVEHLAGKTGVRPEVLVDAIRSGRLPGEVEVEAEPVLVEVVEVAEVTPSGLVALRHQLMARERSPHA